MKGIVFTTLIEFIADSYTQETADDILDAADLPSGGCYTTVASYDYSEIIEIFSLLSKKTKTEVPNLIRRYGNYLFPRLIEIHPPFRDGISSSLEFLKIVDNHIHIEVKKLYPDAELPTFDFTELGPDSLLLTYRSSRPLGDLAHGLIEGCGVYFDELLKIEREDFNDELPGQVNFRISRIEKS